MHFHLIGGDTRQLSLRTLLARDGHTVTSTALSSEPVELSALEKADCILLPMPTAAKNGALYAPLCPKTISLSDILSELRSNQLIFGGKIDSGLYVQAAKYGLNLRDYLLREDLAIANAVPTAEGALQLAMEHLPITIHHSKALIAGFGRVGQCTAQRFCALGAEVTILARAPEQLALAESMGCHALHLSASSAAVYDLIINTIPAPIFTNEVLTRLNAPVLIELASSPGGFDPNAVHALGLRFIPAPGLPGKVAPVTAARIMQKTIYRMLEELDF